MQDLRVIGVENGALLVASDDGERYRIPIDEVLQSRLRQSSPEPGHGRKLSPKEIQAHIRGGMSAQDVASITGVSVEYIERYEGPVLAEREYVVESALAVAVHAPLESDPLTAGLTFGAAISHRLHGLGAINERWASWKEQGSGWVVKLSFTADQVDHDARWAFDPKKLSLLPLNSEAVTLSQQGDAGGALIPRLRAVSGEPREADNSRFDSGAFDHAAFDHGAFDRSDLGAAPSEPTPPTSRFAPTVPEPAHDSNQTADLLEALRRRRGEREAASFIDDESNTGGQTGSTIPENATRGIRLVDVPLGDFLHDAPDDGRATAPQPSAQKAARKGRASMPSWDDIVFGARPDDDPA